MDSTLSFDYNQTVPLDVQTIGKPRRHDTITVRDITFANTLGGRVDATLVIPAGQGPCAGVLWVHWFEPNAQDSNRTEFNHEAIALAHQGVVSLLVDGFWSMTPTKWAQKPGFVWRTEAEHDTELSRKQVIELRRSLDVLITQPGVDPRRVAYVGHDFGAMYGALVAAVDRRPKAYVLMAGTTTFSEWFTFDSDLTKEAEQQYIIDMAPLDPTRYIAKAAPAALYFQFAHSDYYVPERTAQMFFDAASQPKDIAWYEAQHDLAHDEARPDRLRWLRQQLDISEDKGGSQSK